MRRFSMLGVVAGLTTLACTKGQEQPWVADPAVNPPRAVFSEPLLPIAPARSLDPRLAALGKTLFHDTALSKKGDTSCATCHDLTRVGTDAKLHDAADGSERFNTLTVFNAALNDRLFWNGRAHSLEEQIDGPLTNPAEMGNSWEAVLRALKAQPAYRQAFDALFSDGVTAPHVRSAFAAFEKTLLTVDSRFDQFLEGNASTLGEEERKGYALFKSYGCVSCHQGANVGGGMMERMGVAHDFFSGKPEDSRAEGSAHQSGRAEDLHVFRVPSLRLAARTAPYLHDGSVATLDEAIQVMGEYQVGADIPPEDRHAIAAFLESLVGRYEGRSL